MKKYEMIIFDIDGTLCDTVDITYECINEILKKYGINQMVDLENIKSGQGMNKEDFAKNCMFFLDKDLREKILADADMLKFQKINERPIRIYDKVRETIYELSQNYIIAIVSNCGNGYIESILPKIGIDNYVKEYIAASALNISKSDAIKQIMRSNNAKKAIYVGDTLLDKKSSEEARVKFIFAEYGFGKITDNKYRIKDFKELFTVIKQIENRT